MKAHIEQLKQLLIEHKLWQWHAPDLERLQSQQPFAVDTLQPEQWLQWIFIARIEALIAAGAPLPNGFSIAPYFEEVWKHQPDYQPIIQLLTQIDEQAHD
ncbi:YqcC family protein [Vibrio hippocampi]|nr:YqcC family protein [Vibrio hippocampi]